MTTCCKDQRHKRNRTRSESPHDDGTPLPPRRYESNADYGDHDVVTMNNWADIELESISTLTTITVPAVT